MKSSEPTSEPASTPSSSGSARTPRAIKPPKREPRELSNAPKKGAHGNAPDFPIEPIEVYRGYVAELTREDDLANQRVTWLLASQSLLLLALAQVFTTNIETVFGETSAWERPTHVVTKHVIMLAICFAGMVSSRTVGLSIWAASAAWNQWRERLERSGGSESGKGEVSSALLPWVSRSRDPFHLVRGESPFLPRNIVGSLVKLIGPNGLDPLDQVDTLGGMGQKLLAPTFMYLWIALMGLLILSLVTQL